MVFSPIRRLLYPFSIFFFYHATQTCAHGLRRNADSVPDADDMSFSIMSGKPHEMVLYGLDKDGDKLTFTYSRPRHGTLTVNGTAPALIYRSSSGFVGADSFTYSAKDPAGHQSRTATVTIQVTQGPASNYPPRPKTTTVYVPKNGSAQVNLQAVDPEKDVVTFALVTSPRKGTLSGDLPNFVYSAPSQWSGTDALTFKATDSHGLSATGKISIVVSKNGVPNYYPTVKSIIDAKCARCHQDGGVEDFKLVDYETAAGAAPIIAYHVSNKMMPPGQPAADATPAIDKLTFLTEDETAKLMMWLQNGVPEGDPANNQSHPATLAVLDRVDAEVPIPAPYTPAQGDDYPKFQNDWPLDEVVYIVGYEAKAGPDVHHVILSIIPPSQGASSGLDVSTLLKMFLGMKSFLPYVPDLVKTMQVQKNQGLPPPALDASSLSGNSLGFYVPGVGAQYFPKGMGIRIEPGSKISMSFHYNTLHNGDGMPSGADLTKFRFKVEKPVSKAMAGTVMMNPWWLFQKDSMLIPANSPGTSVSSVTDPFSAYDKSVQSIRIYNAFVHAHQRAMVGQINIINPDGSKQVLWKQPQYDFMFQMTYNFANPILLKRGQLLEGVCTYDNSAANQPYVSGQQVTPVDLTWGEHSTDEMCILTGKTSAE